MLAEVLQGASPSAWKPTPSRSKPAPARLIRQSSSARSSSFRSMARNAAALIFLTPGTADLNASNARGAGDTALTFRYPGVCGRD